MQYFILSNEIETKIVGVNDGMGQIKHNTLYDNNPWYFQMFTHDKNRMLSEWTRNRTHHRFYAQQPLVGIALRKKAKLNDIIFFSSSLIFVSDRLKVLLETFNLPSEHAFLPTIFNRERTDEQIEGYWQFVFDRDTGEHTVDFAKSEFDYNYHETTFGKKFKVVSYQDYIDVSIETENYIDDTKLVLNTNFNTQIDFWSPVLLGNGTHYVSARLIAAMNEAKITGARYIKFPNSLYKTEVIFPD